MGHSRATNLTWLAAAITLLIPPTLPAQSATVNLSDPAFIAKGSAQYAKTCAVGYCHGSEGLPARGPGLRGRRWDTQKLYSQVHDGIPNTTMPAWKGILSEIEIWQVVAYIISLGDATEMTVAGGQAPSVPPQTFTESAARGRDLFFDLTNQKRCAICHKLGSRGTAIGPNLAAAAAKPADELLRDITDPAASIATGYEQTVVVTKTGETIAGIKKDNEAVFIRVYDAAAVPPPLRTIYRDEIRSEIKRAKSSMPEGYAKIYSPEALHAIVAFLRSGAYD
jgi:putative heme-binding domain-containing protein